MLQDISMYTSYVYTPRYLYVYLLYIYSNISLRITPMYIFQDISTYTSYVYTPRYLYVYLLCIYSKISLCIYSKTSLCIYSQISLRIPPMYILQDISMYTSYVYIPRYLYVYPLYILHELYPV